MRMKSILLAAPAIALLAATAAAAATAPAKPVSPPVDLQSATCAQFERALYYANPGKNPTKERESFAVTSQDALIQAMMWMNGYLTGRDGAKGMQSVDRDFIINTIGKLDKICKAGGDSMRLVDAAAKL